MWLVCVVCVSCCGQDKVGCREDLLATTGDYLRIWKMPADGSTEPIKMQSLLNNNKNSEVRRHNNVQIHT